MKMPTPTEICVELARENERLKIEIERLKARIAELEKEIVIIGVSSRIEIWSKTKWEEYNESQDSDDIAEKMTMLGI